MTELEKTVILQNEQNVHHIQTWSQQLHDQSEEFKRPQEQLNYLTQKHYGSSSEHPLCLSNSLAYLKTLFCRPKK